MGGQSSKQALYEEDQRRQAEVPQRVERPKLPSTFTEEQGNSEASPGDERVSSWNKSHALEYTVSWDELTPTALAEKTICTGKHAIIPYIVGQLDSVPGRLAQLGRVLSVDTVSPLLPGATLVMGPDGNTAIIVTNSGPLPFDVPLKDRIEDARHRADTEVASFVHPVYALAFYERSLRAAAGPRPGPWTGFDVWGYDSVDGSKPFRIAKIRGNLLNAIDANALEPKLFDVVALARGLLASPLRSAALEGRSVPRHARAPVLYASRSGKLSAECAPASPRGRAEGPRRNADGVRSSSASGPAGELHGLHAHVHLAHGHLHSSEHRAAPRRPKLASVKEGAVGDALVSDELHNDWVDFGYGPDGDIRRDSAGDIHRPTNSSLQSSMTGGPRKSSDIPDGSLWANVFDF
ncbi:unnamed protein product [Pedinophyceae sp. YPF-701]|nr:unnamed protein product [Pedinophyceae sp. YPF-701]